MAIINTGDFPIDPTTTTGTDLADRLNRFEQAVVSSHLNPTRPAYLKAGGVWSESVPAGGYKLYFFDGTKDHEIGSVSATGTAQFGGASLSPVFSATATYTTGQIIYDPTTKSYLQAKNAVAAGPYNPGDWQALGDPFGAFVPKIGGIMTGLLTLSGNPTAALMAATKQYVDDRSISVYSGNYVKFSLPNTTDRILICWGSEPTPGPAPRRVVTFPFAYIGGLTVIGFAGGYGTDGNILRSETPDSTLTTHTFDMRKVTAGGLGASAFDFSWVAFGISN